MTDFASFYKHMSNHYRQQRDRLEDQNTVLWETVINLIKAIGESENDGSGIGDLKKAGLAAADHLQNILDPDHAIREALNGPVLTGKQHIDWRTLDSPPPS